MPPIAHQSRQSVLRGVAVTAVALLVIGAWVLFRNPPMPDTVWTPAPTEFDHWTHPWIAVRPGGPWVLDGGADVPIVRILDATGVDSSARYLTAQTRFPELLGPAWAEGLPRGLQHWISTLRTDVNPVTYRLTGRTQIVGGEVWQECRRY